MKIDSLTHSQYEFLKSELIRDFQFAHADAKKFKIKQDVDKCRIALAEIASAETIYYLIDRLVDEKTEDCDDWENIKKQVGCISSRYFYENCLF